MTVPVERKNILTNINNAMKSGARLKSSCKLVGLSVRTHERWMKNKDGEDKRPEAIHHPGNKLKAEEEKAVIRVCTSDEYKNMAPNEIVPALAEKGQYIASESTFYRILKKVDMLHHRQNSREPRKRTKPGELIATGPNQVWSWDITYLKTDVRGVFLYLYFFMDVWSRKIVGWSVEKVEDSKIAASLIAETCLKNNAHGVKLHSDNGGPMKSGTMLATLQWLGVVPSFSRPHVSDDNPFSESLFKTLKYIPGYPEMFKSIEEAIEWVRQFVMWYNEEHRHSGIKYVTPSDRHAQKDKALLKKRKEVYQAAKARHPERWSGAIRNWTRPEIVVLNPKTNKRDMAACA